MRKPVQVDPWESGIPYENFMGRWSRLVAYRFLEWLSISGQQRWLDVGCGTGVLSSIILNNTTPQEILAVDNSEAFITFAQHKNLDTRLRFQVADARNIPVETGYYDVAVSGLALNFFPDPQVALAEMVRTIHLGGIIAIYVWDYADKMQMLRYFWDAVMDIDPTAKELDEGNRFPICQPDALEALFQKAGLENVEVLAIDVPTVFKDFDDFWSPFLGGQGPAPGYVRSLRSEKRKELEKDLRESLPVNSDGSITLIARAWSVRGSL